MKKPFIFSSLTTMFVIGLVTFFLIGERAADAKTAPEILGLKIGMTMDEAHTRLEKMGTKQKDESKLQEVWTLGGDKKFSHIIIGFNKDDKKVRFINAKARQDGERIRYEDVIDVKKARQDGSANNYKYMIEVPAEGSTQGYRIIARGTDKKYLSYYAVERLYTDAKK